tara:strand:- start:282 stop:1091 length:810 start_codon:yes stop_codon:yes gene_type:complete
MARIRTIKPEFWRHEDLSALPADSHMLAAALLNYADDDGYFNSNPKLVEAECCPLRDRSVSVHDSLIQLAEIGYLKLGVSDDGKHYGWVVNFSEHQRVNRPQDSKIKALNIVWEDAMSVHTQISESSPPEGKGREQGKEGSVVSRDTTGADAPEEAAPSTQAKSNFRDGSVGNGEDHASPMAAVPATGPPPDKAVYDLGKEVIGGNKSGGLVTKLKRHFENDLGKTYGALLTAQGKSDPREYIGGILRGESVDDEAYRKWEDDYYRTVG